MKKSALSLQTWINNGCLPIEYPNAYNLILQGAIDTKHKPYILEVYNNDNVDWSKPEYEHLAEEMDALVDIANDILYS